MRAFAAVLLSLGLAAASTFAGNNANDTAKDETTVAAASDPAPAPAPKAAAEPETSVIENQLEDLRSLIESQTQQLEAQQAELKDQQLKMAAMEEKLRAAGAPSEPSVTASTAIPSIPAASAQPATEAIGPGAGAIAPASTEAVSSAVAQAGGPNNEVLGPDSWAFKGITFTPGGFFAAETVWRQRALNADVNTPFNSLPLPGSAQYNMSEFNASGRQSRIAMLVQGKLSTVKIGGYYEADFLSAAVTSNDNQSNSYALRQRQFWAQAAFNDGFTITGGQMWSLVTQTAKGVNNRTEVLPETIDAQYHVGFSWARQYGMRFSKDFGNKVWLAMSVEEPQTTFKGSGTTTPYTFGSTGTSGGLYNSSTNYSFNFTPDFVFKMAFEPGFGHYEVFGLVSTFRDRTYPTGVAPLNNETTGGGGGANAYFPFDNSHINFGLHFLGGDGVGRYGSAQSAPDATIQPNGTLALVRSYQGLGTLTFHYTKWDIYLNGGSEYGGRTEFIGSGSTPNVGFGAVGFSNAGCYTELAPSGSTGYNPTSPASCAANIRTLVEGTAGLWYSFYVGPKGTMKFGLQYSHEVYNSWSGVGGAPSTDENMFFTSMRYYIP